MATPYVAPIVVADAREPPSVSVLQAIAVAGLATAGGAFALGMANDDVSGIQVLLLEWISIPYVAAGLVAWWRRPDSRLGVLMIAGGFATALSALAFASYSLPHTSAWSSTSCRPSSSCTSTWRFPRGVCGRRSSASLVAPPTPLRSACRSSRWRSTASAPTTCQALGPAGRGAHGGERPAALDQRHLPGRDRRAGHAAPAAPAARCDGRWRS